MRLHAVWFCGPLSVQNLKTTLSLGTGDFRTAVIGCSSERWSTLNPCRGRNQRGRFSQNESIPTFIVQNMVQAASLYAADTHIIIICLHIISYTRVNTPFLWMDHFVSLSERVRDLWGLGFYWYFPPRSKCNISTQSWYWRTLPFKRTL